MSLGNRSTPKLRPVYPQDRGALRVENTITYDSHDNQTLGAHGLGDAGLHREKNDGSEWINRRASRVMQGTICVITRRNALIYIQNGESAAHFVRGSGTAPLHSFKANAGDVP